MEFTQVTSNARLLRLHQVSGLFVGICLASTVLSTTRNCADCISLLLHAEATERLQQQDAPACTGLCTMLHCLGTNPPVVMSSQVLPYNSCLLQLQAAQERKGPGAAEGPEPAAAAALAQAVPCLEHRLSQKTTQPHHACQGTMQLSKRLLGQKKLASMICNWGRTDSTMGCSLLITRSPCAVPSQLQSQTSGQAAIGRLLPAVLAPVPSRHSQSRAGVLPCQETPTPIVLNHASASYCSKGQHVHAPTDTPEVSHMRGGCLMRRPSSFFRGAKCAGCWGPGRG